ncbi:hypothetical protein B7463_g8820, partial [Scytalidium lignicola]
MANQEQNATEPEVPMTIEEMERQKYIQQLQKQTNDATNPEIMKNILEDYIKSTPPEPPIDPTEPQDLDDEVRRRMRMIKSIDFKILDEAHRINREAILEAYRQKKLKVDGQVTFWYNGKMVMGPLPQNNITLQDIYDLRDKCIQQYGPGRFWEENYSVNVRLVGTQQSIRINNVLNDTGSDILEMYQNEIQALNGPANYGYMGAPTPIQTANGLVNRAIITLEVQLVKAGTPVGGFYRTEAMICPGAPTGPRCSGIFLRQNFFTSTSPYNNILYVSDYKTGVVKPLQST